jgi:hypothetical protein
MLYMMLIMAIVNKSFSLVYLLPNQIMRWLGGPTETSDPSDMIKEAKGGFDTGAKMGQAAATESVNQSKGAISDAKSDGKNAKARNDEQKAGAKREEAAERRHQQQLEALRGSNGGGLPNPAPAASAPSSSTPSSVSGTGGLADNAGTPAESSDIASSPSGPDRTGGDADAPQEASAMDNNRDQEDRDGS